MSTIEITYALYTKDSAGKYLPVDSVEDTDLQATLCAVDTNKRVQQAHDDTQASVLADYLEQEVPWEFPISGHEIAFDNGKRSVWDSSRQDWARPLLGAGYAYPVVPTGKSPKNARLYLAVATIGAVGEPPPDNQTSASTTIV